MLKTGSAILLSSAFGKKETMTSGINHPKLIVWNVDIHDHRPIYEVSLLRPIPFAWAVSRPSMETKKATFQKGQARPFAKWKNKNAEPTQRAHFKAWTRSFSNKLFSEKNASVSCVYFFLFSWWQLEEKRNALKCAYWVHDVDTSCDPAAKKPTATNDFVRVAFFVSIEGLLTAYAEGIGLRTETS